MAVMMPFSGVTPEAMPNAMASGRATIIRLRVFYYKIQSKLHIIHEYCK